MEVLGGYLAWAKICSLITAFHVALVDKPLFWAWWKILHRLRFRSIERETDPCENWAQACEFGQMDLKIGGLDLRKSWQTDSTRLDGVNVSLGSVGSSLAKADFCLGGGSAWVSSKYHFRLFVVGLKVEKHRLETFNPSSS